MLAETIASQNAGQPMRRLDIFDHLGRSPDSGLSRSLVTASSAYGLTKGSYKAEMIELLEPGRRIAIDRDPAASVDAVLRIDVFRLFFEHYRDKAFPADVPAKSFLADNGISPDRAEDCLRIIRENGSDVGMIQKLSGQDRVVSVSAARPPAHAAGKVEVAPKVTAGPAVSDSEILAAPAGLPSLNINLEIHLPGDAAPETYDAIFKGIRANLIDVNEK